MINLRISCNSSPISPYHKNEDLVRTYSNKTIPISQYRYFGDDIDTNISNEELIEIIEEEGEDYDR